MRPLFTPAGGAILALVFIGAELVFPNRQWILHLPLLALYPYARRSIRGGLAFALVFTAGIVAEKWGWGRLENLAVWPEILAIFSLIWLCHVLRRRATEEMGHLEAIITDRETERFALERVLQEQRRDSGQSSQQLRSVEHLFDVMREAGTNLNVQEMLGLAQEFTERMFRFRHFVMGMVSADGNRYEIRSASGCDEMSLRFFSVDRKSETLAAKLAAEGLPLWVPATAQDPRWAHLAETSLRSFVYVPFVVRGESIGFLCAYSRQEALLDEERFQNLQVFCNQIAIGLQKALLYEKVQRLSITDGLTKLYSYRYFRQRLDEELVLAKRYSSVLSLLMLDIDHFKMYNDTYGHLAGDQVLQEVAKILRDCAEASHLVARYGGEEMVILAPETDRERAGALAEKIRKAVEERRFEAGRATTGVTVSVGAAVYPRDARAALDLVARADQALYAAKEGGRNRSELYDPSLPVPEKMIDTPGGGG